MLLVGTNNLHKLGEIRAILRPLPIVAPSDRKIEQEPVEDGVSFEENALIKARFFHQASGLPCMADDSGLVVDALDGRPGIHSARYADSDQARIRRLLDELQNTPAEKRSARFVCCCAFVDGETEIIESGFCEGAIAQGPSGLGGFGYDPIFYLAQYDCSLAEISSEQKNKISHRANALGKMRIHLEAFFTDRAQA